MGGATVGWLQYNGTVTRDCLSFVTWKLWETPLDSMTKVQAKSNQTAIMKAIGCKKNQNLQS